MSIGLGILDLIFLLLTTSKIKINSVDYITLIKVGKATFSLHNPY